MNQSVQKSTATIDFSCVMLLLFVVFLLTTKLNYFTFDHEFQHRRQIQDNQ